MRGSSTWYVTSKYPISSSPFGRAPANPRRGPLNVTVVFATESECSPHPATSSAKRCQRARPWSLPASRCRSTVHSGEATDLHRDACVNLRRLDEAVDLEVLAELDVHQPGRGAVVDRRHAVAGERRRVAEPARDVATRRLAPDRGVHLVDRRDELVSLLDLGSGG